jgi:hypothetical protein
LVRLMGSLERGYDPAHATPRSARNSPKILAV